MFAINPREPLYCLNADGRSNIEAAWKAYKKYKIEYDGDIYSNYYDTMFPIKDYCTFVGAGWFSLLFLAASPFLIDLINSSNRVLGFFILVPFVGLQGVQIAYDLYQNYDVYTSYLVRH
jgi:hypothetical protein